MEEAEEGRLNGTVLDDDEQEATELALTDLLEATQEQLQRNNFKKIEDEADELLQSHKLTLSKSSEAYRRLCRELLKAKQVFLKAELDRMDGNYWGKDSADYSTQAKTHSSAGSFTPESVRLFSAVSQDYFKHYEHRDQRTNHEKTVVFNRFMESIGDDKPVQDITKGECVRFRDTYSLLPKRIANHLRGKSMADVLAAVEGTDYLRMPKGTVNLALDDVRHFFSWAIKLDVFVGKYPLTASPTRALRRSLMKCSPMTIFRNYSQHQSFLRNGLVGILSATG